MIGICPKCYLLARFKVYAGFRLAGHYCQGCNHYPLARAVRMGEHPLCAPDGTKGHWAQGDTPYQFGEQTLLFGVAAKPAKAGEVGQ